MKLFLFVVCLLCCSLVRGQSVCSSPPDYARIADDFSNKTSREVNLMEVFYNCIAYGGTGGNEFRELRITARYQVGSGLPTLGQAFYQCQNLTPEWDNLAVILGTAGLAVNETTRGCLNCQGMTSNNCTPCHSSCTGLNRCNGPSESECCNYLDKNLCVAQCGTNMVATSNTNYSCVCSGLYTGEDCLICNTTLCQHGNARTDCSGCVCDSGYTGVYCDTDIDECDTPGGLCQNGGNCTNTNGSFICDCPTNYGGPTCEDLCYGCCDNPCTRGGTCTSNNADDFSCMCVPGWVGPRCQDFEGGCHNDPCMNGGDCQHDLALGVNFYECRCPVGFTGMNCETKIDHCASNPCQNGGWCNSTLTGPVCDCLQGFTGDDCGRPMLTCQLIIAGACGDHGNCTFRTVDNEDGPRTARFCSCDFGYMGELCETPITACINDKDPCYHRSTCSPSATANPSFACVCYGNWTGHYCTDCSLQCGLGRPDAQCTSCICDIANTDSMCNLREDGGGDSGSSADVGLIVGCVVGAVVVLSVATILVIVSLYLLKNSGGKVAADNTKKKSSNDIDDIDSNFFAAMPPFGGSMLRPAAVFSSGNSNTNMPLSHEGDTDDDKQFIPSDK